MHTDSSASLTYLASRSAFRMHDHGLDAKFAAGALDAKCNFSAIGDEDFPEHDGSVSLADDEQRFTVFDGLAILDQNRLDRTRPLGFDLVEQLHRLDDAQRVADS
jgi:hypothetical protein